MSNKSKGNKIIDAGCKPDGPNPCDDLSAVEKLGYGEEALVPNLCDPDNPIKICGPAHTGTIETAINPDGTIIVNFTSTDPLAIENCVALDAMGLVLGAVTNGQNINVYPEMVGVDCTLLAADGVTVLADDLASIPSTPHPDAPVGTTTVTIVDGIASIDHVIPAGGTAACNGYDATGALVGAVVDGQDLDGTGIVKVLCIVMDVNGNVLDHDSASPHIPDTDTDVNTQATVSLNGTPIASDSADPLSPNYNLSITDCTLQPTNPVDLVKGQMFPPSSWNNNESVPVFRDPNWPANDTPKYHVRIPAMGSVSSEAVNGTLLVTSQIPTGGSLVCTEYDDNNAAVGTIVSGGAIGDGNYVICQVLDANGDVVAMDSTYNGADSDGSLGNSIVNGVLFVTNTAGTVTNEKFNADGTSAGAVNVGDTIPAGCYVVSTLSDAAGETLDIDISFAPDGKCFGSVGMENGLIVSNSSVPTGGSAVIECFDGTAWIAAAAGAAPDPTCTTIRVQILDAAGNLVDEDYYPVPSDADGDADFSTSLDANGDTLIVDNSVVPTGGSVVCQYTTDTTAPFTWIVQPAGTPLPAATAATVTYYQKVVSDANGVVISAETEAVSAGGGGGEKMTVCARVKCEPVDPDADPIVNQHSLDTSLSSALPVGWSLVACESDGTTPITFPLLDTDAPADRTIIVKALDADGNDTGCRDCVELEICPLTISNEEPVFFTGGFAGCVAVTRTKAGYHDEAAPTYNFAFSQPTNAPMSTLEITNPNQNKDMLLLAHAAHSYTMQANGGEYPEGYATSEEWRFGLVNDPWLYDAELPFDLNNYGVPARGFCNNRYYMDASAPRGIHSIRREDGFDIDPSDWDIGINICGIQTISSAQSSKDFHIIIPAGTTLKFAQNIYVDMDQNARSNIMYEWLNTALGNQNFNVDPHLWNGFWNRQMCWHQQFLSAVDDVGGLTAPLVAGGAQVGGHWQRWHSQRGICFYIDQSCCGLLPPTFVEGSQTWTEGTTLAGL